MSNVKLLKYLSQEQRKKQIKECEFVKLTIVIKVKKERHF